MHGAAIEVQRAEVQWDDFLPAAVDGARAALAMRSGGSWRDVSYAELRHRVEVLASDLTACGVAAGDRVAILSESRPEWAVAFFAALASGAVAVPLDAKLTPSELACQIENAQPRVLFVSSDRAGVGRELVDRAPGIEHVIVLDRDPTEDGADSMGASPVGVVPFDDAQGGLSAHRARTAQPVRLADSEPRRVGVLGERVEGQAHHERPEPRRLDDVAVITYTSGTTGSPKGVMTTFGNLLFQVRSGAELFRLRPRDVSLSILPLNHLLELAGSLLVVLHRGGQVCFAGSLYPQDVADAIRERNVTRMVVVPTFLTLLRRDIERRVQRRGPVGTMAFRAALAAARCIPARSLRRLLFAPLHSEIGGALHDFVCGGAPLDPAVARFFENIGFSVYQGYGMTETSPAIATNAPGANRLGSVGRPLARVEVRIDASNSPVGEGEILTRGPHVMRGYFRREDLTGEAVDAEGWLHTGDIGRFDRDGYLYVTGRIKDLIVLGGGKKVLPEEVEGQLVGSPLFAEICVVGRRASDGIAAGSETVSAVIVPSVALLRKTARTGNHSSFDAARSSESARSALQEAADREVERLVQDLAPFKRPTSVVVRLEELPKTSTRKIRRSLVQEWLDGQEEARA